MLLIDERPEEVTHFRRAVHAEVLASSNDQSMQRTLRLAELTLAHVRCELECGRDVVVLVDSLTRLVRAFNLHGTGGRRTMSGGIDAGAMETAPALLRSGPQHRKRRLGDDHRHRADRDRLADG